MKVKSLYNVMPKDTNVFICRDITNMGELVDVESIYRGTFEDMTDKELQIWTEEVYVEAGDMCLVVKAKSKEEVVEEVSKSD